MSRQWKCRIAADEANPDEWELVIGHDPEDAALTFAERADDNSGGEIFQRASSDEIVVEVETSQGYIDVFTISFDYSKIFYARHDRVIEPAADAALTLEHRA